MIFSFVIVATAENAMKITSSSIDKSIESEQEVNIYLSNNTGIVGFKLHFEYDPDEVEIISSSAGQVTSRGSFLDNIGSKTGKFDILWNNTTNVSGDGIIAVLKVRLLNSSNAVIHVSYSQADTCSFSESTGKFSNVIFDCSDIVTKDILVSTTAENTKENVSNQIDEIKENEEKHLNSDSTTEAENNEATTDEKSNANDKINKEEKDSTNTKESNNIETEVKSNEATTDKEGNTNDNGNVTVKDETNEAKDKTDITKDSNNVETKTKSTKKAGKLKITSNTKEEKRQIKKVDVIIASIAIVAAFVAALIIIKKRNS